MLGMDVGEVERIGRQLRAEATSIGTLLSQVREQVGVADQAWEGTDATRFVGDWNSKQTQLQALQTRLDELGRRALDEAAQQSRTSGLSASGAGGGGGRGW